MPSLGADMEAGTLIEWHVKPGDHVRRGDIVAVVETDKGVIDVEIFSDGVVSELLIEPDTLVPVGTPMARLQPDDAGAGAAKPPPVPGPNQTEIPSVAPRPVVHESAAPSPPAHATSRRRISPSARVHARELGIDLDSVVASATDGIVHVADVERAAHQRGGAPPAPVPAPASAPRAPAAVQPRARPTANASSMRRAIAAAMSRSKRDIPHYYLAHGIDMEPALRWMEQRNAQRPLEQRLVYGALLIKAAARAVQDVPNLNGFWQDESFVPSSEIHIGVVISLRGGGVTAPALRDVVNSDIDQVMAGLRDVTVRARSGRLKSSELGCATVTVSSLGESGVETVFPIIHPPQVAIVGFGTALPRPWAVDGGLYVHRVVQATLAADHRVSDGQSGAKFLASLQRQLANPETL